MSTPAIAKTETNRWQPDSLLSGFEALTLTFPDDYDGAVVATLVRLPVRQAPKGAVLYVHGFIDYFFQQHLAERFAAEGYAFYALDLRKHGRSMRPHQRPNFCKSINEYFADITAALEIIAGPVVLIGHSTGGLLSALYAHEGTRRDQIKALWLNGPFLEFNVPPAQRWQLGIAAALGRIFPYLNNPRAVSPAYPKSLHRNYQGEWDFDLRLKPIEGFPAYYGWIRAIRQAHARAQAGLAIRCPVLSTHSDDADIVLNGRDIARYSPGLGPHVTVRAFPGALHDVVLSKKEIREEALKTVFAWLERPSGK
ncbi:MAG: alpha/beta hydrolase [Sulfurifustaceae bacterium]